MKPGLGNAMRPGLRVSVFNCSAPTRRRAMVKESRQHRAMSIGEFRKRRVRRVLATAALTPLPTAYPRTRSSTLFALA